MDAEVVSMPGGGPLGGLRAAVAYLARVDWGAVPDDQLHASVVAAAEASSLLAAASASVVSEWDARKV